jgi:hypothetical protein
MHKDASKLQVYLFKDILLFTSTTGLRVRKNRRILAVLRCPSRKERIIMVEPESHDVAAPAPKLIFNMGGL